MVVAVLLGIVACVAGGERACRGSTIHTRPPPSATRSQGAAFPFDPFGGADFEPELAFLPPTFDPQLEEPTPPIQLRMPFPAGVVVLCAQGNDSAPGRTHSLPQNLHALDFSNRVLAEVPIVAAASGRVVYVFSGAGDEPRAGGGYGNQVRILHFDGYFTEYAHLDQVTAQVGDEVKAGQVIGTMGRTGLAGDRHLHFSMNRGPYNEEGLPPTVPIPELVSAEIGEAGGFLPRPAWSMRCSREGQPWAASLYASENDGQPTGDEHRSSRLLTRGEQAGRELRKSLRRRTQLWHYSTQVPRTSPADAERFLEPILAEEEDDPITHYTWAVEVELPRMHFAEAMAHLERARELNTQSRLFEPWIEAWVENQEGSIALSCGRGSEARQHFKRARTLLPIPEVAQFAHAARAKAALAAGAFGGLD